MTLVNLSKERHACFGLINEIVQQLRSGENVDLGSYTDRQITSIKKHYDNYLMYIWLSLGDTRFNRCGYRNATDKILTLMQSFQPQERNKCQ